MASVVGIPRSVARAIGRLPLAGRLFPVRPQGAGAISSLIESEVIPRLMAQRAPPMPVPANDRPLTLAAIEAFAPLTLDVEADALLDYVEALLAEGVSAESILVDLLGPTARRLGLWWEEDRCDFVAVTMALWRLQEVVRELSRLVPPRPARRDGARSALVAGMPGDQHAFGALIVDEMFRRAGWECEALIGAPMSELLHRVGDTYFDLVGLTVSRDTDISRLSSVILAVRSVARNPGIRVLVGGPVFVETPDLATQVGADGTAADAAGAVALAEALVTMVESEVVPIHHH